MACSHFRWAAVQIKHMKEYIAKFGHGSAKLARQAQSKEKTLEKMVQEGLTEKVDTDSVVKINFENVGKLPPPVLQFADVAFGYSRDKVLYSDVDLGVDLDSRVAIVGPNGAPDFLVAACCASSLHAVAHRALTVACVQLLLNALQQRQLPVCRLM